MNARLLTATLLAMGTLAGLALILHSSHEADSALFGSIERGDTRTTERLAESQHREQTSPERTQRPAEERATGEDDDHPFAVASIALRAQAVDARSGRPVLAELTGGSLTFSGNSGGYIEAHLDARTLAGSHEASGGITLSASGYESVALSVPEATERCIDLGVVVLSPTKSVTVRAVDSTGAPVQGAFITVRSPGHGNPSWSCWTVGTTDLKGELGFQALPGEVVSASHPHERLSGTSQVRSDSRILELELKAEIGVRLGLLDRNTGSPVSELDAEIQSRSGYPVLHWRGTSGVNGVLPVSLPHQQVVVRVLPPYQLINESDSPTEFLAVELSAQEHQDTEVTWLKVSKEGTTWLRFVAGDRGEIVRDGLVEVYRDSELPDGSFQDLRVEARQLVDGLLCADPFLTEAYEPLYAIVRAPGYDSVDTRQLRNNLVLEEVNVIRLQTADTGAVRLVDSVGGPAQVPVWVFMDGLDSAALASSTDRTGILRDLPRAWGQLHLCSGPSRASSFCELAPDDIFRDPPAEIVVPAFARLVVEFEVGVLPDPTLQLVRQSRGQIVPVMKEMSIVFDNLIPGSYSLGTSRQHQAELRTSSAQLDSRYPLQLLPGQELKIRADASWGQLEGTPSILSGTVTLQGPASGVVLPLYSQTATTIPLAGPSFVAEIDSSGRFECPRTPDITGLAAGTIDADTGDFIPLTVFPVDVPAAIARGARLVVRADESIQDSVIMQLHLQPLGFDIRGSIVRGVAPGAQVNFGWIPLGSHTIAFLGGASSKFTVEQVGEARFILRPDGTLIAED